MNHRATIWMILLCWSGMAVAQSNFTRTLLPVDPLVEEDRRGLDIALHRNTALVRAISSDTVQVYRFRRGIGWTAGESIGPSDGSADSRFGDGLFLDDSYALLGSSSGNGYVDVYTRSGDDFTFLQRLEASDGADLDFFDTGVHSNGDILVRAFGRNGPQGESNFGAVYVFRLVAGQFVEVDVLQPAAGGAEGQRFGVQLAAEGNLALITADDLPPESNSGPGSVYVYRRQGGSWVEGERLTSSSGEDRGRFGSVSLSNGRALIGENGADNGVGQSSGLAYIYEDLGGGFVETTPLVPSIPGRFEQFGFAVALVGDRALVSSVGDEGRVYVFEFAEGSWTEVGILLPETTQAEATFGFRVAQSEEFAMVGEPLRAVGGQTNSGAVYMFDLTSRVFVNGFESP